MNKDLLPEILLIRSLQLGRELTDKDVEQARKMAKEIKLEKPEDYTNFRKERNGK